MPAPDGAPTRRDARSRVQRAQSGAAPGRDGPAYGALDLGTNNCRLLIARPARDGFRVVDSFSRIVRLGEGLSRTGRLDETAMDRAYDALALCAERVVRRGVDPARLAFNPRIGGHNNNDDNNNNNNYYYYYSNWIVVWTWPGSRFQP
jgi:exopolyphosphatase/guanosine-5'-triphosphate,3'-diphosphate pyrophosphatase